MIRNYIHSLILMVALSLTFASCVADIEANSKSIADYTDHDVQSYGDLFEVFWNVMNQRYCDLYEQAGASTMDWDQVYSEYKPKFDALKSFLHTYNFTQEEILSDNAKAQQYFDEIVGKIIDQHFYVNVTLPVSHSSTETVSFASSLRNKENENPLFYRWEYMQNQLRQDDTAFDNGGTSLFSMMGGFLKDHPDIYYLGFTAFSINENCFYTYRQDYLPVNEVSPYHIDQQKIADKVSGLQTSEEKRTEIEQEAVALLSTINQYFVSEEVQTLCKKMTAYSNKGDYYGLTDYAQKAVEDAPDVIKDLENAENVSDVTSHIFNAIKNDNSCQAICSESSFAQWFSASLAAYLCHERELNAYWADLMFTYKHPLVETYRRCFLEPLAAGKINKLILDVRSNGGGDVVDTRLLTDFLISHTATYCYARKKENNNPYGYSPWVPQQIAVTPNSLGRDIPTVVLLDNYSASMAETTALILKSQGDHVKTVGRNSSGALCMLSEANSSYNGGWVGDVTSYLTFYMPFMMTKDANGNILEAVGITPDYTVDPMTEDELQKMATDPDSATDKDMEKAIEVLQ